MASKIQIKEFSLPIVFITLRRHWRLPLFFIFLSWLSSFFYLRYTQPVYETSSVLQILDENQTTEALGNELAKSQTTNLSEEVELLKSDIILKNAIDRLGLFINVKVEGNILTNNLYKSTKFTVLPYKLTESSLCGKRINVSIENNQILLNYNLNGKFSHRLNLNERFSCKHFEITFKAKKLKDITDSYNNDKLYIEFVNPEALRNEIKSSLEVGILDKTAKTIELKFKHNNAKFSFDVINSIVNTYLSYIEGQKKTTSTKTIDFINLQLDSLNKVLFETKDSINEFQKKEKIISPEFNQEILIEKIKECKK